MPPGEMVAPGEGSWLTARPLPSTLQFSPVLVNRSSAWRMVQSRKSGITVGGALDSFILTGRRVARLGAGGGGAAGAGAGFALPFLGSLADGAFLANTGIFLSNS